METLRGNVSGCQHSLRVSGGSGNSSTTTTYITLFRVDNRAVEFRTSRPVSLSDGDEVVVAGINTRTNAVRAYACRNVTTDEVTNAGVWRNLFAAVFLPIVLALMTGIAMLMFGRYALYAGIVAVAFAIVYFIRQALLASHALRAVQA